MKQAEENEEEYYFRGMQNAENPMAQMGESLRNIACDEDYQHRQNALMVEHAKRFRERLKRHALYSIRQQPYFQAEENK